MFVFMLQIYIVNPIFHLFLKYFSQNYDLGVRIGCKILVV